MLLRDLLLALGLALQDLRFEWILSVCMVLALGAVFAPLFILLGLQAGIVGNMLDELRRDPMSRLVTPRFPLRNALDEAWFELLQEHAVAVIGSPTARLLLDVEGLEDPINAVPTAQNDPLLTEHGIALADDARALVISTLLAERTGVAVGEELALELVRNTGREQLRPFPLPVAGILPARVTEDVKLWLPRALFDGIYRWRKGQAAPEFGLHGGGPGLAPVYDGLVAVTNALPAAQDYRQMLARRMPFSTPPSLLDKPGWEGTDTRRAQLWRAVNSGVYAEDMPSLINRYHELGFEVEVHPYVHDFDVQVRADGAVRKLTVTIPPSDYSAEEVEPAASAAGKDVSFEADAKSSSEAQTGSEADGAPSEESKANAPTSSANGGVAKGATAAESTPSDDERIESEPRDAVSAGGAQPAVDLHGRTPSESARHPHDATSDAGGGQRMPAGRPAGAEVESGGEGPAKPASLNSAAARRFTPIETGTATQGSPRSDQSDIVSREPPAPANGALSQDATATRASMPTVLVAADTGLTPESEGEIVFWSANRAGEIRIPVQLRVSQSLARGYIGIDADLAGGMNSARRRAAIYSPETGFFTPVDRGIRFFRAYAASIDELEQLVAFVRDAGRRLGSDALRTPNSQLARVHDIRRLARYMSQLYLLIVVIAGVSGFFAIAANVYAGVERKRRELAFLQLMGVHPVALTAFPFLKSLTLVAGGIALAFSAHALFALFADQLFADVLEEAESLTRLTARHIGILIVGVVGTAALASLLAAIAVTRIEPGEYIRE